MGQRPLFGTKEAFIVSVVALESFVFFQLTFPKMEPSTKNK
jgi:hypothetical protein